jgi:nucleoside diphosphate kinase
MGLIYYDQKKYETSVKYFSRLILQKDFTGLSINFQLKILISEIIIRYELNQLDLVEEKINSIYKKYKDIINENLREKEILIIIRRLIYCNNLKTDKELSSRIKKLIGITSSENAQNIDIINYNDWLSRKIEDLT